MFGLYHRCWINIDGTYEAFNGEDNNSNTVIACSEDKDKLIKYAEEISEYPTVVNDEEFDHYIGCIVEDSGEVVAVISNEFGELFVITNNPTLPVFVK